MTGQPDSPVIPPGAEELSTAEVSDALDALRLPGSALGHRPRRRPHAHLRARVHRALRAGRTSRIRAPSATTSTTCPTGAVVVLDNAGRMDCTVWGGILSRLAAHRRHRRHRRQRRLPRHRRSRRGRLPALRLRSLHAHRQGPRRSAVGRRARQPGRRARRGRRLHRRRRGRHRRRARELAPPKCSSVR